MITAQESAEESQPTTMAVYKAIARRKEKDYRRRLVASGRACRPYGSLGDDPVAVMVLTPRFERAEREFLPARIRRRLHRYRLGQDQTDAPASAQTAAASGLTADPFPIRSASVRLLS
ncbi:hypothetical protein [Thermogemmatispora tikiterensis]|uniref:Uncharacterized protein n=1 Tax=Thermogemmatispora tikiterensis TaxID=1825093 RepID=A0A328VUG3_9CHLR|nr:hypothetical protein [Thermogemmatispora tikiterensis]RAQ97735.1 hypothetical protein A4R35_19505 [Thermogemmatispora tikiterensis]